MVEVLLIFVYPTFSEVHQNEVRAILLLTLEPFEVNLLQTFNLPNGLMIASLLIGRSKTCPLSITWYQIGQMSCKYASKQDLEIVISKSSNH